jgi:hypothetical protein
VLPSCTTSLRRSLLSPARRAPTSGSRAAHSSRPPLKRAAHLYWCSCCTPQVDPGRAKARHPRARPVLVGLACRRLPPAPTPRPKSTGPSPLPYVVNVCFKCFRYFRGMLQVFHIDVTKVDRGVVYVASVLEACCKRLFKIFHLLQTYVAMCFYVASCKCFIWMLHMFHTHISSVCYKYFICFRRRLYPTVSYFRGRESWGYAPVAGRGMERGELGPVDGACWGRRSGCAAHLGSCGQGALVLKGRSDGCREEARVSGLAEREKGSERRSGGNGSFCGCA